MTKIRCSTIVTKDDARKIIAHGDIIGHVKRDLITQVADKLIEIQEIEQFGTGDNILYEYEINVLTNEEIAILKKAFSKIADNMGEELFDKVFDILI